MKQNTRLPKTKKGSNEPILINRPKTIAFFGMRRFFDNEHLNEDEDED